MAIPVIAAYLGATDSQIARTAALALADMRQPDACKPVLETFRGGSEPTQQLFADACLHCARILLDAGQSPPMELLERLRTDVFPTHVRLGAVALMMDAQPEQAQSLALEALQDSEPALAAQALMLIRAMPADVVTAPLVALLNQAPEERKPALLGILADCGNASAIPDIQVLASHDQAAVRQAAVRALGLLGDAALTDFLLERADSGPIDEQRAAREVLARMADPAINDRLVEIAVSPGEEEPRLRAISLLAERAAAAAAPSLLKLAEAEVPAMRAEAVRALRTLAPADMLPGLIALVHAQNPGDIAEGLPQTLAQTAARGVDVDARADALIAALEQNAEPEPDVLLLDALGLLGGDKAFTAVRGALDTTDNTVRCAAVAALARFQRPEALDALQGLLADADDGVRARAFSAYVSGLRNAAAMPLHALIPHLRTAREHAQSTAEQREFLAAATRIPSLVSLQLIEELAAVEETSEEAARAALRVCAALAGAWPEQARARLEHIAAQAPALAEEARGVMAFMDAFDRHIMAWEMAGPYFEDGLMADVLFNKTFPPETDADKADWRILPLMTDAQPPCALELDRVVGGEQRVLFLRTRILSDAQQEAVLELGTNDGCRVWWNGALIHSLNKGRPLTPGEDKLPVTLAAGANELMLAVFQDGGAWRATARLVAPDGAPLTGLTFRPGNSE